MSDRKRSAYLAPEPESWGDVAIGSAVLVALLAGIVFVFAVLEVLT